LTHGIEPVKKSIRLLEGVVPLQWNMMKLTDAVALSLLQAVLRRQPFVLASMMASGTGSAPG
jgi:hypothetical protein